MDSIGPWLVIAVGVVIVLAARSRKNRVRGNGPPLRMVFVPAAGEPGRRSPFLTLLLIVAVIVGIFLAADWLTAHMPLAPGNRR